VLSLGEVEVVAREQFDQRGAPFARLAGPASDIGAYEAQAAPSADFDSDGDVDGADFLAWQRGFGTTNAQRTDGNSDDDTDVDASDLAAWEISYGQSSSPAVATSMAVSAPTPTEAATPLLVDRATNSARIDAAIALVTFDNNSDEPPAFVEEPTTIETAFATTHATDNFLFSSNSETDFEVSLSVTTEATAQGQPWLDDELLERVFG